MSQDDAQRGQRPRWIDRFPALRRAGRGLLAFWSRDPLTLSASIAFYTSLSFAPLLTFAVKLLSSLSPEREARFIAELATILGPQVGEATRLVLARVDAEGLEGVSDWVALGAIAFSASAVFGQLQKSINRLWGLDDEGRGGWRGWIRDRLVSFGMLVGMGMLLLTTFVASSAIAALFTGSSPVVTAFSELSATSLIALAFALMFHYVPYVRPSMRRCLIAGVVTALLFQLGKWALGLYFARAGIGSAYGPASAIVLLMAWSYYVSLLVLAGSALARPPTPAKPEDVEDDYQDVDQNGNGAR
ncbi:YihY/virulence factor BrkB family protein [Pseudomarimonas salicorniae]|uniref:YihY/virulence factor BrkB family protein n=1 Tax=Pseudomarimonas salicorniae TaxID=2933270 RepID=A0ABT0GM76_9GAMM|nr:YihY/virulence factor BrkB family protein [Lysobacter sp. CAU 1642]MCK7595528.1 YihY/virulence factor BrkB family protein [Lysobacter sp. CAU 1642]